MQRHVARGEPAHNDSAVLGVMQGIAGVTLMMCGCVNLGASLISEAVSDLWLAIDSAIHNKAIDWAVYLQGKAVAVMMAVGAAAWGALSDAAKAAEAGAKEATKEGAKEAAKEGLGSRLSKHLLGEGTKVVRDQATGVLTRIPLTNGDLGWKVFTTMGSAVVTQGVSIGVAKIRREVINSFQSDIETSAQQKMTALFEEPGFKAEISQVHRFDVATKSQWKVRTTIQQNMGDWQSKNGREVLEFIKKVMTTISKSEARSTSWSQMMVSAAAEFGVGAYNVNMAYEFMDDYIKELKAQVHKQVAEIMDLMGVTEALFQLKDGVASRWVAELKKEGAIVGDKPYQQRDAAPDSKTEGVHPDKSVAMKGLLKATMTALNLSESAAKDHSLYTFGTRIIDVAHASESDLMGAASRCWEAHLTASMKGELNAGIAGQGAGLMQSAFMSGAGVVTDAISERYNEDRLKALDAKEAAEGH